MEAIGTILNMTWLKTWQRSSCERAQQAVLIRWRVPDLETLKAEVEAWQDRRNATSGKVDWRFISTEDTRAKLKRLYPSLQE